MAYFPEIPPPGCNTVMRNLYRDSDFAPVDYLTMDPVKCTCHDDPRYACVVHSHGSTWTPPEVLKRNLCLRNVPTNTPPSKLDEMIMCDIFMEKRLILRHGQRHIEHAAATLEEFNKTFKKTEKHKKHEEHWLKETSPKMPPCTVPVVEKVHVSDPAAKPGLWKKIQNGFKSLSHKKNDGVHKKKWFGRRKKQSVSPVESATTLAQEVIEESSQETVAQQDVGSIKTGNSSTAMDKPISHPPSVEELQARSASFNYDPFNPSRVANGGWEPFHCYDTSALGSVNSLIHYRANTSRRASQASSVSQPSRPKPKYSHRRSKDK